MAVIDDGALTWGYQGLWGTNAGYGPAWLELIQNLNQRCDFMGVTRPTVPLMQPDAEVDPVSPVGLCSSGQTPINARDMLSAMQDALNTLETHAAWCDSDGTVYSGFDLTTLSMTRPNLKAICENIRQSLDEHRYALSEIPIATFIGGGSYWDLSTGFGSGSIVVEADWEPIYTEAQTKIPVSIGPPFHWDESVQSINIGGYGPPWPATFQDHTGETITLTRTLLADIPSGYHVVGTISFFVDATGPEGSIIPIDVSSGGVNISVVGSSISAIVTVATSVSSTCPVVLENLGSPGYVSIEVMCYLGFAIVRN